MPAVLSTQDFIRAAERLKCPLASVRAVCEVEAPRGGFNPDGSVVTLFEGHHFHRFTRGKYDSTHPTLSFKYATRAHYGRTWQAEKDRLRTAQALAWNEACLSASWGRFQIMGFNFGMVGYPNVREFVAGMASGEAAQLEAFCDFIEANGLADEMQRGDWRAFARVYNGPNFAVNKYDERLAAAYRKWASALPTP